MKNEGNIPLSFISELLTNYDRPIVNAEFLNTAYKPSDLPVISIEPTRGDLPVGESILLKISFVPCAIAEYSYLYNINYDFKKLEVELKGTGGQATYPLKIIFNLSTLRHVDLIASFESKSR
jgi:hypothetical protein